jgi:hypothetical protein
MELMYHKSEYIRFYPFKTTDKSMYVNCAATYTADAVNNKIIIAEINSYSDNYSFRHYMAYFILIIHDNIAFITDAIIYENPDIPENMKNRLPSEWLEPFKAPWFKTIYDQDRSPEVYILTKQIFHNVIVRNILDQNLDLPNDIIEIIMKI